MKGLLSAVTISSLSGGLVSCSESNPPVPPLEQPAPLPLGQTTLTEKRTSQEVAPGVTYTRINRGAQSTTDTFTVDVAFKATLDEANTLATKLKGDGYDARVETISRRAADDPSTGPMGYLVRVGSVATTADATSLQSRLTTSGYTGLRTVYTGEDGVETTGPWVVHVLEVDPTVFKGKVAPELGTGIIPERELLTALSKRVGSLAAINGGYFVIGATDGTPGDMAGISVIKGTLVSEAVDGRTALILPSGGGQGANIAAISDTLTASSSDGSSSRPVDGLNRKPGLIRACGGTGGDQPVETPKHDFTCTDDSELIQFTPMFGTTTDTGTGVEAVLDSTGTVTAVRTSRGGAIPANGSVLAGTGDAADWLTSHAQVGMKITVTVKISADGADLPTGAGVVNGGPRLLDSGNAKITAYAEGFVYPENAEFYYRFGARRNPRTLAGVTGDGKLLLVAVDGRSPGYSVGASFEESAAIMKTLGAMEALNLDGGGSTTVTLGTEIQTRPSDANNIERPIGDAIVILP
jgi:hypothetical protein